MDKALKILSLLCMLIFAASCGYIGEAPLESKVVYETTDLAVCDIDTDAFSEMMERNIDEAIKCLEQNFRDFQKGVEHDGSGAIDRSVISTFIARFMKEERDSILNSLDLLFKINMLILKDKPDFISAENITNISKLLLITNHSAVTIKKVIDELDGLHGKYTNEQLKQKREQFKKGIENFSQNVSMIINSSMGEEQSLDLEDLIEDIADMVENNQEESAANNFEVEDIKDLLALKTVLVGGKQTVLTSGEVISLLHNLPTLALIVFDANYTKKEQIGGEIQLFREYRRLISEFQTIFKYRNPSELLFTKDDVYKIAEYAADYDDKDDLDLDKAKSYVDAFFALKDHAVSKGNENVHVADVDRLAFYAKLALEAIASGSKVNDLVDEENRSTRERRSEAETILLDAQEEMLKLFQTRNVGLPEFDLQNLVTDIASALSDVDDIDFDFDLIKLGAPLKRLIVGGAKTDFNVEQLQVLISKVKDLGLIFFDVVDFDKEHFSSDKNMYSFFIDTINNIKSQLFTFQNEEEVELMTLPELVLFADKATDNEYNISKFEETIDVVITKFINGISGKLTVKDVRTILNYGHELSEGSYYNEVAYTNNEIILKSPRKLKAKQLASLNRSDSSKITFKPISYYHREFGILVEDLYLYRTEDGNHHYNHDIVRTRYGLNEASLFRFATKKLLAGYCPGNNPNPETCGVNAEELNRFLWDFKPLLEEIKLWSENIESFANNCLYLMDLFQTVSNGDMKIGLKEGTEYFGLIASAVTMGNDILEGLKKTCVNQTVGTDEERDEEPTFLMGCFNDNVLKIWLEDYGYNKYLKSFNRYLKGASDREVKNLVVYLEKFVKDEPDSPIMNKRWITLFAGAILNVESMLIRFDKNRNNILDPYEVDQAYEVYKFLIMELGGLSGSKAKYAKSAFKFMVKEMKFPGTMDVLKYHYNPFASKDITARRINVASILYYFATM